MKHLKAIIIFLAIGFSAHVFADVDCTASSGVNCQNLTGQVTLLVLDNGNFMKTQNIAFPAASKTAPYMTIKINTGADTGGVFGGCAFGLMEAFGVMALDTDARRAMYNTAVTAHTAADEITVVINTVTCEIAAIFLD